MRRLTFRKTATADIAAPIDGAIALFVDTDEVLALKDENGDVLPLGSTVDATAAATSAANAATSEANAAASETAVENIAKFAMPFDAWLSRNNGIDPDLRGLNEATGMQDGDLASVAASDTGTHMQPGDFGDIEVANSGYYIYNGTDDYWQWQYPLDSTLAAASATAAAGFKDLAEGFAGDAEAAARAESFAVTNPNIFTRRELAFEDLSRLNNNIGFSAGVANDSPVGVLSTPIGGPSGLALWRIPVADIAGAATVAASVEIVSATTPAAITFQVRQYGEDNIEITPRTTLTATAIGMIGTGGIAVDADCSYFLVGFAQSSSGSIARTAKFRSMLFASGGEYGFRQPAVEAATEAETSAGTNVVKYVSPLTLKQAAPALIDTGLALAGLTPDIVDFLVRQSALDIPADLDWPSQWPKVVIGPLLSGGYDFFKARALALSLVPPETWTVDPIYVDPDLGNDANSGASMATAFRSIPAAVAAGIASGDPAIHLILKAGATFIRSRSFTNVVWGSLTVPFACTVEGGGRAISSTHDVLTWGVDATYTNTYSAVRNNFSKVHDPSDVDEDGIYAAYTKYASPSALDAAGAVSGWANDATKVYVRRADGSPVTNANCRVFLVVANFEITNAQASVYLEGIRFEGSATGPIHFESTNDVNFAAVDCFIGYTTIGSGSERDGFRIRNIGGLTMSVDCTSAWIDKDAFNQHVDIGTSQMPGIYVNPKSRFVGTALGGSKNAFTLHETARAIVINPDFAATINGSTVANVGASKCIIFGGMVSSGPDTGAANGVIEARDTAEIWIVGTTITGDIKVFDNATVYLRDVDHTGSVVASGSGQVVSF